MKYRNILAGSILFLALLSCDRTRSSTGWDYMPDMYYSFAYESYTPNPNFSDHMTMRIPVEGTIPRGALPFPWEKTDEGRIAAGEALANPLEASSENLARGLAAYEIFCISCHGAEGDGQGYLFTSMRYPYPPASLINDQVKALRDGEIYHSITVGYGIMGAHGGMITPEDRWKIILHIRSSLQK
ncbi:MAG: cytochrome c [Bacteroidales bacterium]|nr:cytochrome c [Bacteroidales bacterium]